MLFTKKKKKKKRQQKKKQKQAVSAPEHCRHTKQVEHLPKLKYNKNSREHYLNKVYKNICGVFTLKLELLFIFVSVSQNNTAAPNANPSCVDAERKQRDGGRETVHF